MAYVPQTVVNKNFSVTPGVAQTLAFAFLTAAGAALDAHAYDALALAILYSVNGTPFQLGTSDLISGSTPSFSTPNTSFQLTAAQATAICGSLPPGAYPYILTAVPVADDDPEILAQGTVTIGTAP